MVPVITIDGESGSGKGTVGKLLAQKLGWHFLDSGAIYRVLALAALQQSIKEDAISALENLAKSLSIEFVFTETHEQRVLLFGADVSTLIRHEECGRFASKIASIPEIRRALLPIQHSLRKKPGLVADGRDMGTVVFPDAICKFFLTASLEERAKRRQLQLQESNINASLTNILHDSLERDARDAKRQASPSKPAADAILVDTTKLTIDEVLQQLIEHCRVA